MNETEEKAKENRGKEEKDDGIVPEKKEEKISPLNKFLQESDVLLMLYSKDQKGSFYFNISQEDEIAINKLLKEKKDFKESLLIFLDTGGGDIYATVKIMDLLRSKYKKIEVGVAHEAKSSGTMMCFGADKIIMGPLSELGPLDKPMIHPDNEETPISALDIVKSLDGIIDVAKVHQENLAMKLVRDGVKKEKAFEIAGDTVSKILAPIISKEDGKIYNQARRLLVIAELYGKEFLNKYLLNYFKDKNLRERASQVVVDQFVWGFPDHAFAIRRNILTEYLVLADKAEDRNYWDELWMEFEKTIGVRKKIIKFL